MDLISYAMGKQAGGGGSQPTGTIEITSNGTHDVSNYASANVNVSSDYFTGNPVNDGSIVNLIKKTPAIDFNGLTSVSRYFADCKSLTDVSLINTSSNTTCYGLFANCQKLVNAPFFDTSNVTSFNSMFSGCWALEKVPVYNTGKATSIRNMFQTNTNNLSDESLNNIMQMCINAVSYTGTKTLKELGLTSSKSQRATTLSNYQAFLDAGWTTGY